MLFSLLWTYYDRRLSGDYQEKWLGRAAWHRKVSGIYQGFMGKQEKVVAMI
jgi:hypothetical protein